VLDGDPGPPPNFRPMSVIAKRLDELRRHLVWKLASAQATRPHRVRWGYRPNSSPEKKSYPPPIFGPCLLWPNGWIDRDATWHGGINFDPSDVVLEGVAAPPEKGHSPQFSVHVHCGQTAIGMKTSLNWYGSRPRPRAHCIRRGPSSPRKGHSSPHSFRSMSIVATVVAHLSYTAELLLC